MPQRKTSRCSGRFLKNEQIALWAILWAVTFQPGIRSFATLLVAFGNVLLKRPLRYYVLGISLTGTVTLKFSFIARSLRLQNGRIRFSHLLPNRIFRYSSLRYRNPNKIELVETQKGINEIMKYNLTIW